MVFQLFGTVNKRGLSNWIFICINQPGTATSSPTNATASQAIINTMLWMKKNAYEESTIRRVAKRLKHLLKNCNFNDPEDLKAYVRTRNAETDTKKT